MAAGSILVLGGTRFLGRAVVEAALTTDLTVTLFNRGVTAPDLFPDARHLRGDRLSDVSELSEGTWDIVIDVAAYEPRAAHLSVEALRDRVGRYVFISTVSVYADHSIPQVEDAALDLDQGSYGGKKVQCEAIVTDAFGEDALIVRPGLIVGPHDPTDRFAYWPRRAAAGGTVLAPGAPDDPLQFIDARDLAVWVISAARAGEVGVFNATGTQIRFGQFVEECRHVTRSQARVVWVSTERLLAAGANPWMEVPLWIAVPGWDAANDVDISKALAAGLSFRPLANTIDDTFRWDLARSSRPEGLLPEREAELLALAATRR
ncbi:MAG: NAD-dependent epimerase/dehydratase family protein [Acidimicrobiia bacterium]|nr:NAD-dependent epimerase/dehydratase family protein [Acidimicrobiia bacterium]